MGLNEVPLSSDELQTVQVRRAQNACLLFAGATQAVPAVLGTSVPVQTTQAESVQTKPAPPQSVATLAAVHAAVEERHAQSAQRQSLVEGTVRPP